MSNIPEPFQSAIDLARSGNAGELRLKLQRLLDSFAATSYSLLYFDSASHCAPVFGMNCVPEALCAQFNDASLGRLDPVMQHLRTRREPIAWGRSLYRSHGQLGRHDFYADHGVVCGIDVVLHVAPDRHFVLGMSWRDEAKLRSDCHARVAHMQTLAVFTEPLAYSLIPAARTGGVCTLSHRELQCLYWISKGLTDELVGSLLRISHRTVRKHVDSAVLKLGARNRTHAAVLASGAGFLNSEALRTRD